MLDKIPPEVLTLIAYHSCLPTLLAPSTLLQTSRVIRDTISPSANPRLYARLYRTAFDTAAIERRLGEVNASQYTVELQRRVSSLYRLSRMVDRGDLTAIRDEDVWTIYLMLIENDGKNLEQLLDLNGILHLPTFLRLYHEQHLLAPALQPGYPAENIGRSLIMWIGWLLSQHNSGVPEPSVERDERLFVLRPYVFAPQQYEAYFAPWTILNLPLSSTTPRSSRASPYIADLSPKPRTVAINYFGKDTSICPPILSHAAILRFFTQAETSGRIAKTARPASENNVSVTESDSDDDDLLVAQRKDLLSSSLLHDRDFGRLLSCHDPFTCRGLKPSSWRGSMEGCWEGNFSFFDFDAFREMLAGQSRALYAGEFGEQHQVWRLKETFVRPKREQLQGRKGKSRAPPLTGPMTNAGFPTDVPSSTDAGLDTARAEVTTLNATIRQQLDAMVGYEIVPENEMDTAVDEDDGLEILVTGVGHSAWGRFILKGRVRAWDGLASLVKEYAPDSRGKWIYRGYVVAGDTFVGRWRDTFTPEAFIGYEGTFILNRR
ncbi:hypothetical protein BD324DRAFT_585253 [Kockovaella imperatae]|uniref:F-box domain-containing protein n=1 Tax=Kockovaella imperatae TaxID=4999 RepID=A0A1Y1U5H8_9TREE|nr:hypothetical protein BD324DRAFT_585253 [Kockovaella imperatae]ORX33278.1 hypothetical protein BD324DRAFT_585253 [Kockovaella imperatae]